MEQNEVWYDFTAAQNVVKLQCKYTLFKRVINILSSTTTEEKFDFELMKKAIDLLVQRNDCLRLLFKKRNGKWQQKFLAEKKYDIPVLKFNTKEEQEEFLKKKTKHPIKWQKGVVLEPYLIETFDGKTMVFFKVCHLILDIYGLSIVFDDLFACYDALKNKTALPAPTGSYEEVVKSDLKIQENPNFLKNNKEFFTEFLSSKEKPFYAGVHGKEEQIWAKRREKGKHGMKMFFIKCDTTATMHPLPKTLVQKSIKYCEENKVTIANFLFYCMSITASKLNDNVKYMLPLELCNCRGTVQEKTCGGTKAQSLACYTTVDHEKSFKENFADFVKSQMTLYRHIGFPDAEFELLKNKILKCKLLEIYYSICFSLIPYKKTKGRNFQIYSNHKGALPCYIDLMFDVDNQNIDVIYDYQIMTHTPESVKRFHKLYIEIIEKVLENPEMILKNL